MKTTIDIPPGLLKDVMRIMKAKTKRDAVVGAMKDLQRREKMEKLFQHMGTSTTFMTQEDLMDMRWGRGKYAAKRKKA